MWARPSASRRRQCAAGSAWPNVGLDPDLAVAHLDRAGRYVVGPQIEGAAARQIEARVMPMTGQDAVLDAAAIERKAHMRAAIVEGEDAPALVDDQDRAMTAVHDEPPLGF